MESQQTTVGGLPCAGRRQARGSRSCIPRIPTAPALWRHVVPLVDRARCLAFEMIGYGQTTPAGRDRDISVVRQAAYPSWLARGVARA
jgi:hypothetical protein